MPCIYEGREYSEGSPICINGGRYICNANEWRNDGNCVEAEWSSRIEDALETVSSVDGVRLDTAGPRRVRLIKEVDDQHVKLVTLKVYGNHVREGKFYVVFAGVNYDIWFLSEGEEGLVKIEKVENAPFAGDTSAMMYLEVITSGTPYIRNKSPHYIYLAFDYSDSGDPSPHYPNHFTRIIIAPGKVVDLAAKNETVKIHRWGTVTIVNTYLL